MRCDDRGSFLHIAFTPLFLCSRFSLCLERTYLLILGPRLPPVPSCRSWSSVIGLIAPLSSRTSSYTAIKSRTLLFCSYWFLVLWLILTLKSVSEYLRICILFIPVTQQEPGASREKVLCGCLPSCSVELLGWCLRWRKWCRLH